jgi:hypothetical protein
MVFNDDMTPEHNTLEAMSELLQSAGLNPDSHRIRLVSSQGSREEYARLAEQFGLNPTPGSLDSYIGVIRKLVPIPEPEVQSRRTFWKRSHQ